MCNQLETVDKFAIYGTGITAKNIAVRLLQENQFQKVLCVFDRIVDPQNPTFMGLPVYPREKIGEHLDGNTRLVIATQSFQEVISILMQIYPNLTTHNIYIANCYLNPYPYPQEDIIYSVEDDRYVQLLSCLPDDTSKRIFKNIINSRMGLTDHLLSYDSLTENNELNVYGFDDVYWGSIKPPESDKNAIIIDGGAYVGDSVIPICNAIPQHISEYYAFEPGSSSYASLDSLSKSHPLYDKLIPIQKGLSDRNETARFALGDADVRNHLVTDNNLNSDGEEISTVALDNMSFDESCDIFIKMDVEGSEMKALKGAEKLIRERKPNLAICVYHKPNDIVDIPLYLKSLVPEYKIYLTGGPHTICQAQVEK